MAKMIKKVLGIVIIVAVMAMVVFQWHTRELTSLRQQLQEEQIRKEKMQERIQDIQDQLASSESENTSLLQQLDDLLTEEIALFDSEAIMEEIREIKELATVEYRFTNVGTIDAADKFMFVDVEVPFSRKTAVVTMDGIIKVGVDVSKVKIDVDENDKIITLTVPEATILSNELFEDSMIVYVEEDSLFSDITLEDSGVLHNSIKSKAEENALKDGLLEQAHDQAGEIIRCLIEATPSVKDMYKVVIL